MVYIEADTFHLREYSRELRRLLGEYQTVIQEFYALINSVNEKEIWIGAKGDTSVQQFLERVKEEPMKYQMFGKSFEKVIDQMESYALELERLVRDYRIGECHDKN